MFRKPLCFFLILVVLASNVISVSASSLPFTDVPQNSEYFDAIKYLYDNNIMTGVSSTEFGCTEPLNRAMLVTILYRLSESYELIEPVGFTDVPEGSYYYYAVGWGQHHGIVNGVEEDTFGPYILVSNQQLVTFLHRYADQYEGLFYDLPEPLIIRQFADYSSIQTYSHDAINWAVNIGIIPSTNDYFYPHQSVNRAVCANYLYLFLTLALGDAKAFVSEAFENCWYGDTICSLLNRADYEATSQKRLAPLPVECAFYNNDVIYVSCHGDDEYIVLHDGDDEYNVLHEGNLYYDDIDFSSMYATELAYISACYAGGTFSRYLSEVGLANYVVGFTDTVTAGGESNLDWGINRFDRLFFEYYTDSSTGGDVAEAINNTLARFELWDIQNLGLGSVVYYH